MKHVKMILGAMIALMASLGFAAPAQIEKPRVIVTSDGEVDDECSMVRFLLYSNDWDVEGIITSSSQYHWQGHKWAGDDWIDPYLEAYAKVYPNLIKHDKGFPTAEHLRSVTFLGNVKAEGEMSEITEGSQHIVKVLLDRTDNRPVWLQAWGGTNTIARALKTIEEQHPDDMAYVANKIRFFFIWEQDNTYQDYILPHWGKYQILTIISDQFWALAYQWKQIIPEALLTQFEAAWMKEHILQNHGPLASLYPAHKAGSYGLMGDYDFTPGDFRSEGDSPAFLHTINTGLGNLEHPDWGGWGGRYVRVRNNTWLDPVPVKGYEYPEGRWYTGSAWGRMSMREGTKSTKAQRTEYFKPLWRWGQALQNDFAARADWSVKPFEEAPASPFHVVENLFDKAQPDTLGLAYPTGLKTTVVFKSAEDINKYNHGAVLFAYKEKLYVQWQSSAIDEDASDTVILYSVSDDGITWQAPKTLVAARDGEIVTNGGWWQHEEKLIAYINVWPESLTPKEGYVEYIVSDDGNNWSQPQRVRHRNGGFVEGVIEQDLRQLPNGRILTTVHSQPGLIATPYYTDHPSGIMGWQAGKMQNLPHAGQVSRELEPSWFIRNDNSLVMTFRDQDSSFKVLASQSHDYGKTWAIPIETNMPDSRAKQSAGNLPDGSAFIVNNPSGTKTRIPLTITLSDDGYIFDRAFLLRAGGDDLPQQKFQGKYKRVGYSYPKSFVWRGYVYVSYAVNKEDIAVTRVPVTALQE